MDESEDNMNVDKIKIENVHTDIKQKKRSLVERELETSLTPHVTAPVTKGEGASTSRYGRARRIKNSTDFCDTDKSVTNFLKTFSSEKLPINCQPTSPVYKMQASNSLIHESSPKKEVDTNFETQIQQIYNSNISLSRFGPEEKNGHSQSPAKKFPVVYVRKDIIQSKEKDSPKNINIISPARSANKSNSHLRNILERSSEKYDLNTKPQNGFLDNLSVVKTLDFDFSKKKKKESKQQKSMTSKSDLFELEAKCLYQVGDLAWARMGTFPFWPCMVTREPGSDMFVKIKLFGKTEHDIIHVTFFGDNGRRSWVLDSMLRKFQGLVEFETARDQFTPEAKKKDPKLHAAFFISDKKLSPWHTAIEEAEIMQREPKRLRIDLFCEMLGQTKLKHTPLKVQKSSKVTRTDSDVSLSESLFDSLFSEDDGKLLEVRNKKNKSLDVSEVVTACLDNMAAKTGMTMIQRQSHMDIWLQKAKSKTPEKLNISVTIERIENDRKSKSKERDSHSSKKKKSLPPRETPIKKPYSFRKSTGSQKLFSYHNDHNYSKTLDKTNDTDNITINTDDVQHDMVNDSVVRCENDICVIDKVESLCLLKAQNHNTISEIREEIITNNEVLPEVGEVTEDTNISKALINQPEAMDRDDCEILNKETEHKEVEQLPDKNITMEHSAEALITKTEQTVAFITENGAKSTKTAILKLVNLQNRSETDNIDFLKQKDQMSQVLSLDNTSIDNVISCDDNQGTSKNINTAFDEKNKDKSKVLHEIGQKELANIEESTKIGPQHLYDMSTTMDISVDDVTNLESRQDSLGIEIGSAFSHDVDETNRRANEYLTKIYDKVKLHSLQNENVTDNHNKVSTKSMDEDETNVSLSNKEKNTNEISSQTFYSDQQAEPVNSSDKIPIVKLTVIKEASFDSFRKTQPILESTTPKRRSSRRPKPKTEKEYKPMEEPDFLRYLEMSQDAIIDENPELSQDEIVAYLYKIWQFRLRKPDSPTAVEEHEDTEHTTKSVVAHDEKKSDGNFTTTQENKSNADLKVSQSKLENCWKLNKRSLRLHKSRSTSKLITGSDDVKMTSKNNLININDGDSKVNTELIPTHSKYDTKALSVRIVTSSFAENKTQSNSTVIKENKCKEVEVPVTQLNCKTKSPKKRSLRIRRSQPPSSLITEQITTDSKEGKSKVVITQASLETNKNNKSGSQSPKIACESIITIADNDVVPHENDSTAIKEDQSEANAVLQSNFYKSSNSRLRKSRSSSSLITKTADDELKEDKSELEVKTVLSQPNLEAKRSLRLRKSQSPSVSKKTEDILESEFKTIKMKDLKLYEYSGTQENNNKDLINNIDSKIYKKEQLPKNKTDLEKEMPIENKITTNKDMYVVKCDKTGLRLRISKTMFEPKVVLERKKEICENKSVNSQLISDDKPQVQNEIETKSGVESEIIQPSLEMKSVKILDELNSHSESKKSLQDKQENRVEFADKKKFETKLGIHTEAETVSQDKIPEINGMSSDTEAEYVVSHSKRRSLRLRRPQSPSKLTEQKQEHDDQSINSKMTDTFLETNNLVDETRSEGEIRSNISQNESSNVFNVPVEDNVTNKHTEINDMTKADNISIISDLTNEPVIDHSSDKDFDPDTVSLSSMTSELSNVSEVLTRVLKPKLVSEKNNVIQKILESDNDSISSLDDITLSELKTRSKEKTTQNLKCILENSMDSFKSDNSERKLRLVLNDCILDTKDSNLPVIKNVRSEANEEFEISEFNTETTTRMTPGLPTDKSPLEPKINGHDHSKPASPDRHGIVKVEMLVPDPDTISIKSSGSETSIKRRGKNKQDNKPMEEPEFLQYLEMKQDALLDEHPEVTPSEAAVYLYKTWQYEESLKSDIRKNEEVETSNLVKGSKQVISEPPKKKKAQKQRKVISIDKLIKKSPKNDLASILNETEHRELPKRKASKAFYKEDFSDIEDEIQMFEIFKSKQKETVPQNEKPTSTSPESVKVKLESDGKNATNIVTEGVVKEEVITVPKEESVVLDDAGKELEEYYDEEELYFEQLTNLKPNVFKGLIREKVCEICEKTSNLVKCKGCSGMFHIECVKKEDEFVDTPVAIRGRKKKKKPRCRKPKSSLDSNEDTPSDEKSQDLNVSEENMSVDDVKDFIPIVIPDAESFESQLEAKMKEIIETVDKIEYDSYSSDDGIDWADAVAGKCEIVDIKPKTRPQSINTDYFKCKNCQKDDTPICFVCKSPVSPRDNVESRQKCQVPHCHKYYHLECLEHWPQTQFNTGEPSKNNKNIGEHFEAMACPRHVCHTCVCDDPRGCKTRFSGDKLARCVRCPATYHSFTKCLPAGSKILSASHIVCPRHYEHRPGKVPYHVNTGWCFICALGGNLICCDYCPTSFHADCLNIEPPEGGYMCEDCETGRLPLYGEMVWVKLGHYRWWPGIVLHPSEIPDNILAVKHSPGEFVVRFFGQYDHYWVNRGRVFPFQEGDSGRISTQKSKIDDKFSIAMEHAYRAFEILKNVEPNDEENQDIQSSLLPPHYVKLKVNKPFGALYGKKIDIEESSLTQCECNPDVEDPCGPYSHCLNRMLLTECGPICRAGERCQNRAFEKRQYPKLVPYRTPHRGWGLKALEPIKAGQFVIEYVGELIDEPEFRRRMQRKHEIRDENFYFLTLDKDRLIDAGPKGNLARFMNHCCEPNCETQKWTVLGDVRVGLFALRDIPANTEVTFNYNLECTGIEKKQCMCGAKRCAGYIGAKPKQDEPPPKKLKAAKRTYKKRKYIIESPSSSTQKTKRPVGRPVKPAGVKPRELTEIEKDLLIIKNATNGISSDSDGSGRLSSVDERNTVKALKRKRVSFSTEEAVVYNGCSSPSLKKVKLDDDVEKSNEVGD